MAKEVITIVGRDNATPAFQSAAGAATEAAAKINTAVNSVKNISNSLEKAGINAKSFSEKITFAADLSMALSGVKKAAEIAASALARPLQEFSRFEDAATRMAPLVGGLSTAKSLCEELRDEAANGTMSFEQLASVAGRLSTVFSNSADIKKWTTVFHDLSAGTGLDINEIIGNFVKSKASGRFEAGFLDMFAQKGVNIFPELVKQTGIAETELRKMAAAGTLSFAEVEKAILAVSTGTGQFAGQASAMSNTFGGSVGTMVAHWNILLAKFAEPIAEVVTPIIQRISASLEELQPVFSAFGEVVSSAIGATDLILNNFVGRWILIGFVITNTLPRLTMLGGSFSKLQGSIGRTTGVMRTFSATVRISHGSFGNFARGLATMNKSAVATAATLRTAFPTAIRAAKAAIVSTGVGALVILVGEAIGFLYEKLSAGTEAEEKFAETMEQIKHATENVSNDFSGITSGKELEAQRQKIKEEEAAWRERLNGFEENSGEYKHLFVAFTTWKQAAENADLNAQRQIDARKRAERIKAAAEELSEMRKHSENLRAEISKLRVDATREVAEGIYSKIQLELTFANVDSVEALDRELAGLSQLNELTAEQDARSKELLATKQKIDSLEKSAAAARASLREKVQLMQAELAGNDKLLALKEKLYRADLRSQFLKAGVPADKVEEQVQKYIDLEKQLEAKRKRESADKATAADDAELEILKAKAAGDEKRAKQLERERKELEHIRKLEEQGVPAEEAKRRARERANAELSIEEQKLDSVAAKNERAAATFEVRTARGTETRTAQDVPAMRAVPAGTSTGNAGDATGIGQTVGKSVGQTLIDINIAIRDNTRGILDVLRRGISPQKVLVNPVLS